MPWTPPVPPVTGSVITVAYAVANLLNPINWLRAMTGNADPPGAGYVVGSTSASATNWQKVTADLLGTDVSGSISTAQSTANSGVANAAAAQSTANAAQSTASTALSNAAAAQTTANTAVTNAATAQSTANSKMLQSDADVRYWRLDVPVSSSGNVALTGSATLSKGGVSVLNQTEGDLRWGSAGTIPSGLIAAWPNGSIPPGWARYTPLDGRLPVGDGTTASQTFSVGTNYGSAWSHAHDLSSHLHAQVAHTHGASTLSVAGNTGGVVGGVSGTSAGGSGSSTVGDHSHLPGGLDVSGSMANDGATNTGIPSINATSTVGHMPLMNAVMWIQKT